MSFAASGAGRYRDPWEIRKFLNSKGTSMSGVAVDIGLSPVIVQQTVKGVRNNRKVLAKLRELGCPVGALSLPEDMKEKAS
ncbi:hypothetical protein [Maridesulfovibrio hydrothermalis]|uniref:HTH cro/C1-type domain-containing protein n=1 Tax=Maridesulfovibrio hydrothermalis AM13 = DSM 14728 TaxID=1121451 RepID=L0R7N0_9BACT|nr:hypothetical protein [Maridesulfovibrio hydrothermalis]CCO22200.1 conserved protein of unknown function [Maridesulfovibrio hydrothermalis AM13 = DSM 14728]